VTGTSAQCRSYCTPPPSGFRRMPWEDLAMRHSGLIAPHLQAFFAEYLAQQKRLSPQTIVSCRDTFRLWLTFLREHCGIAPSAVRLADVEAPAVLRFLAYLHHHPANPLPPPNIPLPPSHSSL